MDIASEVLDAVADEFEHSFQQVFNLTDEQVKSPVWVQCQIHVMTEDPEEEGWTKGTIRELRTNPDKFTESPVYTVPEPFGHLVIGE